MRPTIESATDRAPIHAFGVPNAAGVRLSESGDQTNDPYAESELRLRHERTERAIRKAQEQSVQ